MHILALKNASDRFKAECVFNNCPVYDCFLTFLVSFFSKFDMYAEIASILEIILLRMSSRTSKCIQNNKEIAKHSSTNI